MLVHESRGLPRGAPDVHVRAVADGPPKSMGSTIGPPALRHWDERPGQELRHRHGIVRFQPTAPATDTSTGRSDSWPSSVITRGRSAAATPGPWRTSVSTGA